MMLVAVVLGCNKELDLMKLTGTRLTTSTFASLRARASAVLLAVPIALSLSTFARALDTLEYSFESGTDGFTNNPATPGITATQDTVGATAGTHSLRVDMAAGDTFDGILTTQLPSLLNSIPPTGIAPPGIDHVHFDLTIPQQFAGNFANIGVFVFGVTNDGSATAAQAEFIGFARAADKPAGTYFDQRIDLSDGFIGAPLFVETTFNNLIGPGPQQITPTSFEFYVNKPAGTPFTFYIDNIRFGATVPGDYALNGSPADIVDAADYTIWRDTLGSTTNLAANGDNAGASAGKIDLSDFAFWKSRFNANTGAGGGGLGQGGVPEPGTALLAAVAAVCCFGRRLRFAR
jgi:hypothetical protein